MTISKDKYPTIRIWTDTRKLLRKVAAETGEQMVGVMDRLVKDEWRRVAEPVELDKCDHAQ